MLIFIVLLLALPMALLPVPSLSSESSPSVQNRKSASWFLNQGKSLYDSGQFEEAAILVEQAADVFAADGDTLNQAAALSNLALTYKQYGQWESAKTAIDQSLVLLRTQANTPQQTRIFAQTLDIHGHLQREMGQAADALETWRKATNLYAQMEETYGILQGQLNQALAMQDLGLFPRACDLLLAALETDVDNCDALMHLDELNELITLPAEQATTRVKVQILRNLGDLLLLLGRPNFSRLALDASLKAAERLDPPGQRAEELAVIYLSLGNVARIHKDYEAALAHYKQAAIKSETNEVQIRAELNRVSLYVRNGLWSNIPEILSKIRASLKRLPHNRIAVYARINLAHSLICLKARTLSAEENLSPLVQQCIKNADDNGVNKRKFSVPQAPDWIDIEEILTNAVNQAKALGNKRAEAWALGYLAVLVPPETRGYLPLSDKGSCINLDLCYRC